MPLLLLVKPVNPRPARTSPRGRVAGDTRPATASPSIYERAAERFRPTRACALRVVVGGGVVLARLARTGRGLGRLRPAEDGQHAVEADDEQLVVVLQLHRD